MRIRNTIILAVLAAALFSYWLKISCGQPAAAAVVVTIASAILIP